MIIIKSEQELALMRVAGQQLDDWLKEAVRQVETGEVKSGKELSEAFEMYCNGLNPPDFGMPFSKVPGYGFPICISVNDAVVHGRPSNELFKTGDLIKIDAGLSYKGWCADAARTCTFNIAEYTKEGSERSSQSGLITGVCYLALMEAAREVKPGNHISDISRVILTTATRHGFSVVTAYGGHGIGAKLHEDPNIPNDPTQIPLGKDIVLREGMTFCIEPMMIAGPNGDVVMASDKWKVYSANGAITAHFEDTVAVTKNGVEFLSNRVLQEAIGTKEE